MNVPSKALPDKRADGRSISCLVILLIVFLLVIWLGFLAILGWQYVASQATPDTRESLTVIFRYEGANAAEMERMMADVHPGEATPKEVAFVESSGFGGFGTMEFYSKPGSGFSDSTIEKMQSWAAKTSSSWAGSPIELHEEQAIPNALVLLQPAIDLHGASKTAGFLQSVNDLALTLEEHDQVQESISHSTTMMVTVQVNTKKLHAAKVDEGLIASRIRGANFESGDAESRDLHELLNDLTIRDDGEAAITLNDLGSVVSTIGGLVSSYEDRPVSVVSVKLDRPSSADTREQIEDAIRKFAAESTMVSHSEVVWLDQSIGQSPGPVLFRFGYLDKEKAEKIAAYFEERYSQIRATWYSDNEVQNNLLISGRGSQEVNRDEILDDFNGVIAGILYEPVIIENANGPLTSRPPVEFALTGLRDSDVMQSWTKDVVESLSQNEKIKSLSVQEAMEFKPEFLLEVNQSKGGELGLTESAVRKHVSFQLGLRQKATTLQMGKVELEISIQHELRQVEALPEVMIPTENGSVPLGEVATIRISNAFGTVRTIDDKLATKVKVFLVDPSDRLAIVAEIAKVVQKAADRLDLSPPEFDTLLISH